MTYNLKVFKAIADETRIKILILLLKRNICAKGIANHLNISEAAVSQHIKVLKDIDLIVGYKRGYNVVYDVNKTVLEQAVGFLKLLIDDDTSSLENELGLSEKNNVISKCSPNCKVRGMCCRKNREV